MMQVEGIEVRPGAVRIEVGQRVRLRTGEDIVTDNHVWIAGLKSKPGGLLESRRLSPGMSAKGKDVPLIPGFKGHYLAAPSAGHCLHKPVSVAQVGRLALPGFVRPRR